MNFEEEFKNCNEALQQLRSSLDATTNGVQRANILREIAYNNGKITILREVINDSDL